LHGVAGRCREVAGDQLNYNPTNKADRPFVPIDGAVKITLKPWNRSGP